jgi:hypothetical protein
MESEAQYRLEWCQMGDMLAESKRREAELQAELGRCYPLINYWAKEARTLTDRVKTLEDASDSASIKLANLTADLRVFENTANGIWRNQQMSTQAVASGLLDLIVKFTDHAFVQIEAALGMKPVDPNQALAAKEPPKYD